MLDVLGIARSITASNLGAAIVSHLQSLRIEAYIYDPVTVDELIDLTHHRAEKY